MSPTTTPPTAPAPTGIQLDGSPVDVADQPRERRAITALPTPPPRGFLRRSRQPFLPRGWVAPSLVNVTWPYFLLFMLAEGLLLAAISTADLYFIKTALDPLLGGAEILSWIMAAVLAVISAALAVHAGRCGKTYRATGEHRTLMVGLLAAFAAVAVGLFVMRWIAGDLTAADPFNPQAATTSTHAHHVMAIVLAALHVATGATAFLSGFSLTNPEGFALRTARWSHARVQRDLTDAESTFTRLAANLGARVTAMSEAPQAAETAKDVRRAVAAHVQAAARARILQHLGTPSAGGITLPKPGDILPPDRPESEAPAA